MTLIKWLGVIGIILALTGCYTMGAVVGTTVGLTERGVRTFAK